MLNLSEKEESIVAYWKDNRIDHKVREKNRGSGKPVYFLDGPPYVTGDLHPGHIWVKSLKDLFVRYKRFRGFDVVDRAGYDVHGLPTENAVERKLKIQSKKEIEERIGIEQFVKECRDYIEFYMARMKNDYERFGVSLDFSDPYLPHTNGYMETGWALLKIADEKGFMYQGSKTTAYCPHCESVVSQGTMEVEHEEETDPSIFITFKVDTSRSKAKIKIPEDTHLLVWTTTPWTLPANVAIAVNPKERYVLAKVGGKNMILAKERFEDVVKILNESAIVIQELYGSELDGFYYINALEGKVPKQKELRKFHRVVFAEQLVSVKEGTGLVHIAPGHGLDDYTLGVSLKLPIFSPVATNATYNEDGGAYKGIKVPEEANKIVLEDLHSLGVLLHKGTIRHSYPHCWRCHTKVIFIASPQWFLNVQKIKKKMLRANEKISWHPEEARAWERDILTNSPDWCISRQRYWDIPMPIWICEKCKSKTVIGSRKELAEKAVNPEKVHALKDLHRPFIDEIKIKCSECGGESKRVPDITDVWWDSSIAFRASLTEEQFKKLFPVEFVVEYVEQIRAWFQYTLKSGLFVYGKSPIKNIVVHGILWGADGKKMSKSLGNYKPLSEMVEYATADSFRLWALEHDPILNRNLNETEIRDENKIVMMLYNIANLLKEYEEAADYKPKNKSKVSVSGLNEEDLWILSRMESITKLATESLDNYRAFDAVYPLKRFIVEDFSRFYIKLAKKRVADGGKKELKTAINVISYVLYKSLVLMSPIMPFVTESVYLDLFKDKESIFLEDWPKTKNAFISENLEKDFDVVREAITAVLNSREKSEISLRWPVASATFEVTDDSILTVFEKYSPIIEDATNAKKLVLKKTEGSRAVVKPLFAKLGPAFKEKSQAVAEALKNANAEEITKAIDADGHYSLHTEKGTVNITAEHFTTVKGADEEDSASFKYGRALVDKNITKELKDEGFVREFERGVQMIRKELKLKKSDKISLGYEALGELSGIINANSKKISKDLNSTKISSKLEEGGLTKNIDIDGTIVKVSVKKI